MISMSDINKRSIPRIPARALGAPVLPAPPPDPDFMLTGFTGPLSIVESAVVLAVTGAAAFVGIRTGLDARQKTMKIAGWVGGVGSAVLGLLYLGGKSGYMPAGIPAMRVTPS